MSNSQLVEKNLKLSADFNSYVVQHPSIMRRMPESACIIFESGTDAQLTRENRKLAQEMNSKGKKCYIAKKKKGYWSLRPFAHVYAGR